MNRISSRLHLATRPKLLISVHREIDVSNEKFVKPIIILVIFSQTAPGSPQCRCFLDVKGMDMGSLNLSVDEQGSRSRPGETTDGQPQPRENGTERTPPWQRHNSMAASSLFLK